MAGGGEWKPFTLLIPELGIMGDGDSLALIDNATYDARPFMAILMGKILKEIVNSRVVFISLERPINDFVRMGRRLGYDLNLLAVQKRFLAIDGVSLTNTLSTSISVDLCDSQALDIIVKTIEAFCEKGEQRPFIFIDGLGAPCSLNWPVSSIITLLRPFKDCGKVIVRLNRDVTGGDVLEKILCHQFSRTISIKSLTAGINRQSHGEIILVIREDDKNDMTKRFLFKTTDSSILVQEKPSFL